MKKLFTLLGTLALVLTLAVSAFAADLPVYSFDKDIQSKNGRSSAPYMTGNSRRMLSETTML